MRSGEDTDGLLAGGGGISGETTSPTPGLESPYWLFYEQVAAAQLAEWKQRAPGRLLDLSGRPQLAQQLADGGHDCTVDAVLAQSQVLSSCLAAEVTVEGLLRVLRPGGRLLLVVDSLLHGLARLADQGRWAELADLPSADLVLVPDEDGAITRCFWPQELRDLLAAVGFEVEWVRPRTVLSPQTVERALHEGGDAALRQLVRTELTLAAEREGESTGLHLVASARRPG